MEENTVHWNAKGVDFLTLHPKALQLWHHILAGNHIGVHIGGNPGPVHAVIRQDADEGNGDRAVFLQIRDHLCDEGMGGQDDIGLIAGNGGVQHVAEGAAELGHQPREQVFPVGLLIQPPKHGGNPLCHKAVAVADGLVEKAVDGL